MSLPDWLPKLVLSSDFEKSWPKYEEGLFAVFKKEFISSRPNFEGKPVGFLSDPKTNNKPKTFWHIITEDLDTFHKKEEDRIPVYSRCERISWIRPIIENCDIRQKIYTWKESGKKGKKLTDTCVLADFDEETYLIVLKETKRYFLLWTAYPIEETHQKKKLLNRYNAYQKMKTAT